MSRSRILTSSDVSDQFGRRFGCSAAAHGDPEDAPAKDAEHGQQIYQPFRCAEFDLFGAASRLHDLVEDLDLQRRAYQESFSIACSAE